MKRFKYPKTMHFPWSPGLQNDDRMLESADVFLGKEVVITEKFDGENTSIYTDHIHARSLDSQNHSSRNWVRAFAAQFQHNIPNNWRICGENMYAMHSIFYNNLQGILLIGKMKDPVETFKQVPHEEIMKFNSKGEREWLEKIKNRKPAGKDIELKNPRNIQYNTEDQKFYWIYDTPVTEHHGYCTMIK